MNDIFRNIEANPFLTLPEGEQQDIIAVFRALLHRPEVSTPRQTQSPLPNPGPGFNDLPESSQLSFQDPASPVMEQIIILHDYSMFFLLTILVFVLWILLNSTLNNTFNQNIIENINLETVWTILPAFILVVIAYPSLNLLYITDEIIEPGLTIKSTGNQWYWTYEYSDYNNNIIEINSYMISIEDLNNSTNPLLEVNESLIIPINTNIRILVTSADVLHSFTIPSLGINTDAIPGRLNQINFLISRPGTFYGQCSELCGTNHSFMPIVIESVSLNDYSYFIRSETEHSPS